MFHNIHIIRVMEKIPKYSATQFMNKRNTYIYMEYVLQENAAHRD